MGSAQYAMTKCRATVTQNVGIFAFAKFVWNKLENVRCVTKKESLLEFTRVW